MSKPKHTHIHTMGPTSWKPTALAWWAMKALTRASTLGLPVGQHVSRYRMYHDLKQVLITLPPVTRQTRVLGFSRPLPMIESLGLMHASIDNVEFPEYDIRNLHQVKDDSYDLVLCDQVLEHVEGSPQQAIDELRRVLRPGGIAVVTTCQLNEPHGLPYDFWRFSVQGLAYLCRDYGRVVQAGSWGNRMAFLAGRYLPVPHARWHPIHKLAMRNEPGFPIVTWIVAQK